MKHYRSRFLITKRDFDFSDVGGEEINNFNSNKMNNWTKILNVVVYAVIASVLSFIGGFTSITELDWNQIGYIALVAGLSALVKEFGTTEQGTFLGMRVK